MHPVIENISIENKNTKSKEHICLQSFRKALYRPRDQKHCFRLYPLNKKVLAVAHFPDHTSSWITDETLKNYIPMATASVIIFNSVLWTIYTPVKQIILLLQEKLHELFCL